MDKTSNPSAVSSSCLKKSNYPFSNLVNFMIQEVAISIKVLLPKRSFPNQLVGHFTLQIHEKLQHLENKTRVSK